jgi:plasmid stability protein
MAILNIKNLPDAPYERLTARAGRQQLSEIA